MRRLLLICVGLGALLALAGDLLVRRLALTEWRGVQRRYNEQQRREALPSIAEGIRAVDGPHGPERCVTCHLGTVLPDAHDPPFSAHPTLPCTEPLHRLGCVSCHGGVPLALTRARAHGLEPAFAASRLLPAAQRQAGCAVRGCHGRVSHGVLTYDGAAEEVALGLELFLARGCPACHRLDGVYHASAESGPSLSGVGARLSRSALAERLAHPTPPMPPVEPGQGLDRLLLLLQAQRQPDPRDRPSPRLLDHFPAAELPSSPSPAAGALWARRLGCAGCHRLGPADAGVPDLRHVAWTTTAEDLRESLLHPERRFPGTRMPALGANETLVESLVQYLALQRVPLPSSPPAVFAEVCARCHGVRRDPRHVVLSRRPPLLEKDLRLSREAFVETAARGRKGTAMAAWGKALPPAFLGQIYDLLRERGGSP
jgi:mono/diheme cytochrome c family protein